MLERDILNQIITCKETYLIKDIQSEWFEVRANRILYDLVLEHYKTDKDITREKLLNVIDKNYKDEERNTLIGSLNHICKELSFTHFTANDLKDDYYYRIINKSVKELNGLDVITQKDKIISLADRLKDTSDSKIETIEEIEKDNIDKLGKSENKYLPTPYESLNTSIIGYEGYTIIGGRPSMGKTDFLNNNIIHFAKNGYKGIYFTLEDSKQRLWYKILSHQTRVNRRNIYKNRLEGFEMDKLQKHKCDFKKNIFVYDKPINIYKIKDIILHLIEKHNIKWFAIDYIERIEMDYHNDLRSEINKISAIISGLIQNTGIVGFVLSQVNVRDEKENIKHHLGHLKESGRLEADADMVIYTEGKREDVERIIFIAKNRIGPVGSRIRLAYWNQYGIMEDKCQ